MEVRKRGDGTFDGIVDIDHLKGGVAREFIDELDRVRTACTVHRAHRDLVFAVRRSSRIDVNSLILCILCFVGNGRQRVVL